MDELQKKDGELGKTIDEIKPKMTNGTAGAEEVKKFNDAVKEHGTVNGLLQMAKSEVKQAEQKQEEKIQEYVTFSKKNGPGGPPSNANPPAPTGPFK